jgi:hypothetical protein
MSNRSVENNFKQEARTQGCKEVKRQGNLCQRCQKSLLPYFLTSLLPVFYKADLLRLMVAY